MQCPRCAFVGNAVYGMCPKCGYMVAEQPSTSQLKNNRVSPAQEHSPVSPLSDQVLLAPDNPRTSPLNNNLALPMRRDHQSMPLNNNLMSSTGDLRSRPALTPVGLQRGDILRGRYRLLEPVALPKNQLSHGSAWLALDTQGARQRVLLRQISLPQEEEPQKLINDIVSRFRVLSKLPGFPPIMNNFFERGAYYIVQAQPEGLSLAALMQRQGGALPERDIAQYSEQLCEMLSLLSMHKPPLVHGAISPDTIIVNPETQRVWLAMMPFLHPSIAPRDNPQNGYIAPEQVHGEILPSSDLYSVAATMHHAVTGYDPRERLQHFYPPARRLNPLITASLEVILTRQLRLSVKQRYTGPADMRQELSALIASYPPVSVTPPPVGLLPTDSAAGSPAPSRPRRNLGIFVGVAVVVLLAVLSLLIVPGLVNRGAAQQVSGATATAQAQQAMFKQLVAQERQNFQKQGIGISDGSLVFDTYQGRSDVDLKQQAAKALQRGDMDTAVNLLNQAVSADPIDGEAQIYNENLHILQNNAPYVTIALGLPVDGSDVYLASDRTQLQAVYLMQHETNANNVLPDGLKLRILIANSGANNDNVATVAQFIADRVSKAGNPDHIIAVVGWPYSTQTINARDIIAGVHIPLVSQTASSVKLSGSSPYFYRVCPADDLQGLALGSLLINQLKAKKILILRDPTDLYSTSLADAVASRTLTLGAAIDKGTFTEKMTSVDTYQQMVENAVQNNTDTIFIAGYNVDGIRLAHAVGEVARANPTNPLLANLKVVGGDTMASGVLVGRGNNADANLARTFPQDMRRLLMTSYADVNEWNLLKISHNKQPQFFSDWSSTYQSSTIGVNAPDPTYESMLIYDATGVITHVLTLLHGTPTGDLVRNALNSLGKGDVAPYQGVSGRILFNDKGNPIDKAVVVLAVQDTGNGTGNEIKVQQVIGTFQ